MTSNYFLAFYALLIVGEITASQGLANHTILFNQLFKDLGPDGQVTSLKLVFISYKHYYNQMPVSIIITRQSGVCPVQSMLDSLAVRGSSPRSLFIASDGNLVMRSSFSELLNNCFKACNLDPMRYKGHSFRIGAVTLAAQRGVSDMMIQSLGRGKSDAFKKYIRSRTILSL